MRIKNIEQNQFRDIKEKWKQTNNKKQSVRVKEFKKKAEAKPNKDIKQHHLKKTKTIKFKNQENRKSLF